MEETVTNRHSVSHRPPDGPQRECHADEQILENGRWREVPISSEGIVHRATRIHLPQQQQEDNHEPTVYEIAEIACWDEFGSAEKERRYNSDPDKQWEYGRSTIRH